MESGSLKCSSDLIPVKDEPSDHQCLSHNVPSDTGWLVEFTCTSEGIGPVFAEIESCANGPKCFLLGTQFLKMEGSQVQVESLSRGMQLQGPEGAVVVEQADKLCQTIRRTVTIFVNMFQTFEVKVAVTDDHRMRLTNNVYRMALDLRVGDFLCTTHGEFPISKVEDPREETISVYAVTFSGDRSVFMNMAETENNAMVAAFGAVHQMQSCYIEFRFKGPVCRNWNEAGSAEAWLSQFQEQLDGFDIRFLTTSPYSVWVGREQADRFFDVVELLLPNSRSRLRSVQPPINTAASLQSLPWRGLQAVTEEQLLSAMPAEYVD